MISPESAWAGNSTWVDFIAYAWQGSDGARYVVIVNYDDAGIGREKDSHAYPHLLERQRQGAAHVGQPTGLYQWDHWTKV